MNIVQAQARPVKLPEVPSSQKSFIKVHSGAEMPSRRQIRSGGFQMLRNA